MEKFRKCRFADVGKSELGKNDRSLKIYKNGLGRLGVTQGHWQCTIIRPHLILVVISSNDRAILYSYRDDSALLCQKSQKFLHPRINYCVDLRHYLTDPYQIW